MSEAVTKDYDPTDYEYVIAALCDAKEEGLTLEEICVTIQEAETGKEFFAGVSALVRLKDFQKPKQIEDKS